MAINFDKTDIQILRIIQKEGRITVKAMAERLGLSTTPVFERLKKLEKESVIDKYVALLNPRKIEKRLCVFVSISLKNHTRTYLEKFIEEMKSYKEVQECYHIAGDFDFLLKIALRDMEEYETFILTKLSVISNIAHVKSSFVLSKNKYSTEYNI